MSRTVAPADPVRVVPPERLRAQILEVLTAWGLPADQAEGSAEVMLEADLYGIESHGIATLLYYEGLFRDGAINLQARVTVERETAATAALDADGSLGHAVSLRAMAMACQKARQVGVGVITVRRSDHYGAAGCYVVRAAEQGLVALAFSNGHTRCVVPAGGVEPMFSTNPVAFAAPGRRHRPFMFDVATSTVSIGKVNLAWLAGRDLPPGWVIGDDGASITDAQRAREVIYASGRGGLTPLGGTSQMSAHKGYGLSAMVEILAAVLPGAMAAPLHDVRPRQGAGTDTGHCFIALDPAAFRDPAAFLDDMDELMDRLRASRPAAAGHPVRVPGDPEWAESTHRRVQGIPLGAALAAQLRALCHRAGCAFVLDPGRAVAGRRGRRHSEGPGPSDPWPDNHPRKES